MLFGNSLQFSENELTKNLDSKYSIINDLYDKLKKRFDTQIENGKKMDDIYYFSSKKDIMYDALFHYISKLNSSTKVKNIFHKLGDKYIEEIEEETTPSITDDVLDEQITTYETELNEELGLIDEEEVNNTELDKYYDMLGKEKEVKLESLSRFAQEKNKKDRIEKHSFDHVIDNFGDKVYQMIDSLIEVFNDFLVQSLIHHHLQINLHIKKFLNYQQMYWIYY